MPAKWPIRSKLWVGLGLLLIIVLTLFGSGSYGLYAYRGLVKGLSARSTELPLADRLSRHVADMRITLSKVRERMFQQGGESNLANCSATDGGATLPPDRQLLRSEFLAQFDFVVEALDHYRKQLNANRLRSGGRIADDRRERETLGKIDRIIRQIRDAESGKEWLLGSVPLADLDELTEQLQGLTSKLPSHMHERLHALASENRALYRTAIVISWVTLTAALVMLALFVRMFYQWIAKPLGVLVRGTRVVAGGNFKYRIQLDGDDEMTELATAMNAMTGRFCEIRDDLDQKVRERTKQVVRSEQLASVGYLAAGVAHEINNPLASIAICSESLESRLAEVLEETPETAAECKIIQNYVQMIQQEAFRCKQITEKLLDFSRMGDSQRHPTDLRELVSGVIDTVRHLGKYHEKRIELLDGDPVVAEVNVQEMKQVVLNLITNGLDSIDAGGHVRIDVRHRPDRWVELVVEDDGCGMTDEVKEHIFEPFFTRNRSGQGTGLGLSITYRIIDEHDGHIDVKSGGPGTGSRFIVSLPLAANQNQQESHHRYHAA
ncbi:MAG: HAMP domain-containing histidine kinase [Pirellulales bacterium]|nr:HAMP domain-containing histidine kinase [Pirellulales bacterium]